MGIRIDHKQSLQEVTDIGNTTTNDMIIRSNKKILFTSTNDADTQTYIRNDNATSSILILGAGAGMTAKLNGTGLGINGSATGLSLLNCTSTNQYSTPLPRMTTTQKNALGSLLEGAMVYDITLHKICVYNGTAWETVTSI